MAKEVRLKKGRDRSVQNRHPWIFSGSVANVDGDPADGDVVEVLDTGGNWLARGVFNQRSQLTVRLLTWRREETIDRDFWGYRLARAIAARADLESDPATTAYRLVHAESDGLPGLTVDRYGDYLAVQFLAMSAESFRGDILNALADHLSPRGIFERSDVDVREKEGLQQKTGVILGEEPPEYVQVLENGMHFYVDVKTGQKTGFYIDQRHNRTLLAGLCKGAEVLDAFSYTGAWGVCAARAGATEVTLVDSSADALDLARKNFSLNGIAPGGRYFVEGNVFSILRGYRADGRHFDVIVLDPPKFAPTRRDVKKAARAYKDINLLAFQLLRPGGTLFSSSCSGAISPDLFQKILFGAAIDARRDAQIIGILHQGADHPVALTFPEGAYLKGLICRVW
jgi:23S rRNA (cytosine1962-C5)-methyltransferase